MPPELPSCGIAGPATLEQVRHLAEWVRDRCRGAGIGEGAQIDLELAVVEAANNIVEHAGGQRIGLDFVVDRGTVAITICDDGRAVPPGLFSECHETPLDAAGGRGLGIVRACVDAVQYASADGVNRLTLTKLLL